ncbi:hypothetical protein DI270_022680 [Microbispora triticiradicis]|uniref:Secreted protein n=1 Tax=Microbispora triticiradicis TaxID=2200763 RepID=A0ABX9LFV9_9ACTN|nr:hypothetical protein [Microbispora triticiradicis]RGA02725.1 hypothetical protein DI270_022680 [Microbispora triticiradicis]GLW25972.1 hypothetical protein Mame01_60140 [Microbispora amethystogenes]
MRSRLTAALLLLLHAIFLTTGFLAVGGSPAAAQGMSQSSGGLRLTGAPVTAETAGVRGAAETTGQPAATTGTSDHAWSSAVGDARLSITRLSISPSTSAAPTAARPTTARPARAEDASARNTTARHWGSPSAGRPAHSDQPRIHAGPGGPGATAGPVLPPASASPRGGTRVTRAGPDHDDRPAQRPRRTTAARAPPSTAY